MLAYQHVFTPGMMMLVLMLLSMVKAGMIMNWFMHLGSEAVHAGADAAAAADPCALFDFRDFPGCVPLIPVGDALMKR